MIENATTLLRKDEMCKRLIMDDVVTEGICWTEAYKRELKKHFINLSKESVLLLGGEQGNEKNNE